MQAAAWDSHTLHAAMEVKLAAPRNRGASVTKAKAAAAQTSHPSAAAAHKQPKHALGLERVRHRPRARSNCTGYLFTAPQWPPARPTSTSELLACAAALSSNSVCYLPGRAPLSSDATWPSVAAPLSASVGLSHLRSCAPPLDCARAHAPPRQPSLLSLCCIRLSSRDVFHQQLRFHPQR